MRLFVYFLIIIFLVPTTYGSDAHNLFLDAFKNYRKSEFEKSVPLLKKSIERDPNFPEAYFLLSRTYFKLGKPRIAIQTFKKGLRLKRKIKEHMDFIQSEKALDVPTGLDSISFQSVRRIQEARKAYYQGRAAMQKGHWYESIEFFERAAALDNEQTTYLNALGYALLDIQDLFSSMEVFERSLKLNPFQRDIYEKIVRLNGELNYPHRALKWVKRGRRYFPADPYFKDRELYYDYRSRLAGIDYDKEIQEEDQSAELRSQ